MSKVTLTIAQINAAARSLEEAEQTHKQVRQLSQAYPDITMADAYAIQKAWMEIKHKAGHRTIGYKIGLTSKAMQLALNIGEPDSGVLLDNMVFADSGTIPEKRFIAPRVEAELAFILKTRIEGNHITMFDVLNATDYVVPAIEILDTRVERLDPVTKASRKIYDTVADNAANAGIVMGGRAMRPDDLDMRMAGAALMKNGEIEETGLACGVLNHPANSVAWLARKLTAEGTVLQPGQVVLSGSFVRPVEARSGDVITADYGPLGVIGCRFA